MPNLHDYFEFGKQLGVGTFATVIRVTEKATGKIYAMKVIEKANAKGMENQIVKEVGILKKIKHANIVRMYECFETKDKIYMQMEYVDGGELLDRIINLGYYGEEDARRCITCILEAVGYLHKQGIVHRDLKPENLLMASKNDNAGVKLTDFGLSTILTNTDMLKTSCGTLTYCAPEILSNKPYGKEVDLWSLGIITYILLGGYPPFNANNESELIKEVIKGAFEFHSPDWDEVPPVAKDFINRLLKVNPKERMSVEMALTHPWLLMENTEKNPLRRVGTNLKTSTVRRVRDKPTIDQGNSAEGNLIL